MGKQRSSRHPRTTKKYQQPWYQKLWAMLRSEEWADPIAVFICSRVALFLLATAFVGLVPTQLEEPPTLIDSFMQWDSGWYRGIVNNSYSWTGPDQQSNVAFFPLYPLIAKVISFYTAGNVNTAMFLVSNAAFLVYLHYLYKLTEREFEAGTAQRAILYVALCPLTFYFSAGYTESLMLALATASIYYAREGTWRAAIPLASLASAARLAGIIILAPLALAWYQQKKKITLKIGYLLFVPLGLGLFVLYLWDLTGDPFAFNTVQQAWNHHLVWPWEMFEIAWGLVRDLPATRYVRAIAFLDLGSMVVAASLVIAGFYKLAPTYWVYSVPMFLLSISAALNPETGLPTASVSRYLLAIFPAFMTLAHLGKNKLIHYLTLSLFAVLLGPLMLYFFAGIWVE